MKSSITNIADTVEKTGVNNSAVMEVKMKFLVFIPFIALFFTGCKCSDSRADEKREEKIYVLSTLSMISDLVSEIGKDRVVSATLIKGELDPHTYELVKGDDEKFARADLIFYNGLDLEHGYSLRHHLKNNEKAYGLGDHIFKHAPSKILKIGMSFDPHIWMDISLWMEIIDPITEELIKKDPLFADTYRQNAQLLKSKMQKVDEELFDKLQKISPEKRYLVTSHNAFQYFIRRYFAEKKEVEENKWAYRLAAPLGLAPEAELSLLDIIRVLDYVREKNIHVIFAESNVNTDPLKKMVSAAKEKGLTLRISRQILYADSMGEAKNYLEMIQHNANTIIEELERD